MIEIELILQHWYWFIGICTAIALFIRVDDNFLAKILFITRPNFKFSTLDTFVTIIFLCLGWPVFLLSMLILKIIR